MKKIVAIDLMRAASILYIVGFWHLMNYTEAFRGYMNEGTYRVTVIVLALFVMISGYLLGRKKIILNKADLSAFYKKRFLRVYPPFLAAIAAFAVMKITSLSALAKSTVLLSIPFGPSPHTLWFIVMLMLFYAMAPLLISMRDNTIKYMITCGIIMGGLLGFYEIARTLDVRMLMYFPAFAVGIFIAGRSIEKANLYILALGALISILLTFDIPKESMEMSLQSIPMAFCAPLLIFSTFLKWEGMLPVSRMVSVISFASFFMYLFHRPVYKLATFIYLPDSHFGQMVYLFIFCLPLVIGFSWVGQRIYDLLADRIFPPSGAYKNSDPILSVGIAPIEAGTMKQPNSKKKDAVVKIQEVK